jgi:hypothetical protein
MSRVSLIPRIAMLAGAAVALPTLFACLNHPLKPVEYEKAQEDEEQVDLQINKDVDILFIIDNSGSMGEEQAKLSSNFDDFITVLEAPDVDANYRIGVTTTDRGQSQWCNSGTIDNGKLLLSSCLDRPSDFEFDGDNKFAEACGDYCLYDDSALTISETVTHVSDGVAEARPWLESIDGARNVPDGITMVEAFQCFGPQGINGCGFESHLESQYVALKRANIAGEGSYGFIRPNAILAIMHVTDEADCSNNQDHSEIFLDDSDGGNQVFWSDTGVDWPSSAVCWNAGVGCTPDSPAGFYDECHSVDKDVNGNTTTNPDAEAVLYPLSRYIGQVQDLENIKKEINADQEVIVGMIGGVNDSGDPIYPSGDGGINGFVDDFGIGPGCSSGAGDDQQTAVPPVRLAEFTTHFEGEMFSVCSDNYGVALERVAELIRDQIQPACYSECVKDTDPQVDGVQPECTVTETLPGNTDDENILEECARDAAGAYMYENDDYVQPNDDVNVCFVMLTDRDGFTASPYDDVDATCDPSVNLEFKIARRPGFPAEGGTKISAKCSLSDFSDEDCG